VVAQADPKIPRFARNDKRINCWLEFGRGFGFRMDCETQACGFFLFPGKECGPRRVTDFLCYAAQLPTALSETFLVSASPYGLYGSGIRCPLAWITSNT
jgi:hypothetical protein